MFLPKALYFHYTRNLIQEIEQSPGLRVGGKLSMKLSGAVCAALLLLPLLSMAQAGSGSIGGLVTDPSGAAVPNATVDVINTATAEKHEFKTLNDGRYLVPQLLPGTYEVTVNAQGFKRYDRTGIVLQVGDALNVPVALEVGSTTETINVSGQTPLLNTENAETGAVIDNVNIMNQPQLDRDPFGLVRLSGNVLGGVNPNNQQDLRINGGRTSSVEFYVDGNVVTTGRAHNLTTQTPSMDAVDQFKVVTNGVSAEFGRVSGGYVELISKSGSNQYHGDLYEYFQNDLFNASSWYNNATGTPKPKFHQNDYGFTLGGPVRIPKLYNGRDKTFFFVDNEYFVSRSAGNAVVGSMPTAAERSGDFTNTYTIGQITDPNNPNATITAKIPTLMYDPNGRYGTTQVPNPFDGNLGYPRLDLLGGDGKHVPAHLISPTSAAILSLLPMPNQAPNLGLGSDANNYITTQNGTGDNFRIGVRLDQVISDKQRLSIQFRRYDTNGGTTRVGGPLFTANQTNSNGGDNGSVNYDYAYTPTFLINARASVLFNPYVNGALLPVSTTAAALKIPSVYEGIIGPNNIPQVQIDFMGVGSAAAGIGGYYSGTNQANQMNSTTYDFNLAATKILSHHTIKFGFETRRYYDNFLQFGYGGIPNLITFDANPVAFNSGDHGFESVGSVGNSLGAFELGIADWNNASGTATRAMNVNYNALFVQDDFKVTPKLTVNMGLRWDAEGPTTERHDKIYFWDQNAPSPFTIDPKFNWQSALSAAGLPTSIPAPAWVTQGLPSGAVMIAGTNWFPSRTPQALDLHQFAPRLGIAYQLNSKTVVRAFGGVMYLPTTGDAGSYSTASSNIPLANAAQSAWHASNDNMRHYISTWNNPFPLPGDITYYTRDPVVANVQASINPGPSPFSRYMHMPHEFDWGFNIQRQLPWQFVAEAAYTANRGVGLLAPDLISTYPRNLFTPAYSSVMTTPLQSPILLNGQYVPQNGTLGPTQQLGILEYPYPQYATVNVLGTNMGSSMYNAFNLRIERRFTDGISILMNYTYSHLLDNVGGPEADSGGGPTAGGQGQKPYQTLAPGVLAVWGLSANDIPNRLSVAYNYQFPVGRGRRWLGSPQGFGQHLLEGIVGGWQFSGYSTYNSGSPVIWGSNTSNSSNTISVNTTFGSYTSSDHNPANSGYKGDNGALLSPTGSIASLTPRFDATKVTGAKSFVYGNLPPLDPNLRNPPFYQTDLSLMKNFNFTEARYLQFRIESANAFNIRGFGGYDSTIGDPAFGLITSAGNGPRNLQFSARIIF